MSLTDLYTRALFSWNLTPPFQGMPPTPPLQPRDQVAKIVLPALAGLSLVPGVASPGISLGFGVGLAATLGNPYQAYTGPLAKRLLTTSLVGLGAGMNLRSVGEAGLHGFGYTLTGIALCLGFGQVLGRILGIERRQSLLTSIGTAICGGSAIAAAATALGLKPKSSQASVALGTVFTLNSVALYLFPWLGHQLHMSPRSFGFYAALAIHDTSSVVGAAQVYGGEALQVAIPVKMARALWIIPLTLGLSVLEQSRKEDVEKRETPAFPWFIVGFVAASALATFVPEVQPLVPYVTQAARQLMLLTLFLIGSNLSLPELKKVGPRPFLHGFGLWVIMGGLTLAAIEAGLGR